MQEGTGTGGLLLPSGHHQWRENAGVFPQALGTHSARAPTLGCLSSGRSSSTQWTLQLYRKPLLVKPISFHRHSNPGVHRNKGSRKPLSPDHWPHFKGSRSPRRISLALTGPTEGASHWCLSVKLSLTWAQDHGFRVRRLMLAPRQTTGWRVPVATHITLRGTKNEL